MFENLIGKDPLSIQNNFQELDRIRSIHIWGDRKGDADISIMIPTYLRNIYLPATIESVLNQETDYDIEIIVVDNNDNMNDQSTLEIIKRYSGVCYYKNEKNLGMFGNWNRCLTLASSEWVLILHDDDTLKSQYVDIMMGIAYKNPNLGCIGCSSVKIDREGNDLHRNEHSWRRKLADKLLYREVYSIYDKDFYYIHPINIMGLLINRRKAIDIGGFDARWDPTSDYIFILNLSHRYKVMVCEKELLNYRVAVNSSLTPKHLIGMMEIDALMRRTLCQKMNLFNKKIHQQFLAFVAKEHQYWIDENWMQELTEKEKRVIWDEYEKFNSIMAFPTLNTFETEIVRRLQQCYFAYVRYLRR